MKVFEAFGYVFAVYMGVGVIHHLYQRYILKPSTDQEKP